MFDNQVLKVRVEPLQFEKFSDTYFLLRGKYIEDSDLLNEIDHSCITIDIQSCISKMGKWAYCSVCGDQASRLRYSHYGAVSCFSCRAFFRRAVEKGSTYFCQKYETCEIDKISRKKCAACRFAKCKNVGMKHGPFSNVSYSTQML